MNRAKSPSDSRIQSVGIDNGGTWLRAAALEGGGKIIKTVQIPSPSIQDLPKSIQKLFKGLKAGAGLQRVHSLVVGSKGVWTEAEKISLAKSLKGLADRILTMSDVELAHRRYFRGRPGVLLIAGTGSIGYGRNGMRIARSGGLGPKKGDEGSGYWIGKRWIQIQKMNGKKTGRPKSVRETARLAESVIKKAGRSETYSFFIVQEAADYLAKLVWDTARKLDFAGDLSLACHGGLFKSKYFQRELLAALPLYFPGVKIKTASSKGDAALTAAQIGLERDWKKYLRADDPPR